MEGHQIWTDSWKDIALKGQLEGHSSERTVRRTSALEGLLKGISSGRTVGETSALEGQLERHLLHPRYKIFGGEIGQCLKINTEE